MNQPYLTVYDRSLSKETLTKWKKKWFCFDERDKIRPQHLIEDGIVSPLKHVVVHPSFE